MPTIEFAYDNFPTSMNSSGTYTSAEITYKVFDVEDEQAALLAVLNSIEKTYKGLALDSVKADERLTETSWQVVATYKSGSDSNDVDEDDVDAAPKTYSFQAGGGTTHLNQSLKTTGYARSGDPVPNFSGAIEWDGNDAKGVDIYQPAFNFKISKWFKVKNLDTAFLKNVYSISGTMNSKPFRGYPAGEVLFHSVEGSWKDSDTITELVFYFMASPNMSNYKVGDIDVKFKYGWDHQWVYLSKKTDETTKTILSHPQVVYIERVYRFGDFGKLGLN